MKKKEEEGEIIKKKNNQEDTRVRIVRRTGVVEVVAEACVDRSC